MIKGLDHVAIAVDQMEEGIRRFAEDLGLDFKGIEDVEGAQTTTAFFPVSGTQIELIHPLRGQGPVVGFLEKRGPGLHHICFETDDIEADMKRLSAKGYRLLSESPQPGAHGTRVVFIHPKTAGGVLIELVEYPREQQ
jgi:methylmalonyl-CoA/ethylmalonyl-CoA epimerase